MTTNIYKRLAAIAALMVFGATTALAQYGGGSGWEDDPYIISTTAHLDQLATTINNGGSIGGGYFRLDADLDYSGKTYTPIGRYVGTASPSGYYSFDGCFDGNGHEIKNVTINSTAYCIGLFGVITGTVKNLTLGSGSTINGGSWHTGGIVGYMRSYAVGDTECGIFNCVVREGVSITGGNYVGGIIGYDETNFHVNGNLCLATVSGTGNVGGIIGNGINNPRVVGNYYASPCNVGGINGADVQGKAEKAYALAFSAETASAFVAPTTIDNGIVHNGKVYAPAGAEIRLSKFAYTTQGFVARYAFSGGTSVVMQREVVLTIPANDVTATVARENVWGNARNISTTEGLDLLAYWTAQNVDFEGLTFNLNADLDYTGLDYHPIGSFRGVFNGNGNTISNVVINGGGQYKLGLFSEIYQGEVKNLRIDNCTISGGDRVGGIAGYVSQGTVRNCVVGENVSISGDRYVGGIVGYSSRITLEDNLFRGSVSESARDVGSIVGYASAAVSIARNYNIGNSTVGGISGTDRAGRAERAYSLIIQATESAEATYQYPTALTNAAVLDGQYYAPNEAQIELSAFAYVEDGLVARYSTNAVTIVNQQRAAVLTMPASSVTVTATPEDVWNGNREISTTEGLDLLSHKVNKGIGYADCTFSLEADLDYTNLVYQPVGINAENAFRGVFNGNGHTISGININGNENNQGLFGYLDGEAKHLKLENSSIKGNQRVGGIAGTCHENGKVMNCVVGENVSINGDRYVGSLVGYILRTGTVEDNLSFATVSASGYYGSLIGQKFSTSVVSNNYYSGSSTYGGMNNNDVPGQAMRGYPIAGVGPLVVSLPEGATVGVAYDNKVYAGEGQEVTVIIESTDPSVATDCISIGVSPFTDNGDGSYTFTMPAEAVTIGTNIVKQEDTYYSIDCVNGTATVVFDESYLALTSVMIDDTVQFNETKYPVTAIGDGAFDDCAHLQWFDCHANLLSIGDYAFRNCDSLEYLGLYQTDTPPTLGTGVFDGMGIDTLWLMVPFCSQYEYAIHPVWSQFGEIFPDGDCEYNFIGLGADKLWSNPDNWSDGEMPGEGAQVGIMSDCEMDTDVTVGSITIGYYYDEEYGYYERLTVKDGATLTATNFIYTSGDARNFVIEDGGQLVHPNAGMKATVQKTIAGYVGEKDNYYLIGYSFAENDTVHEMDNLLANDYDLYYYDEPTHYWMNQELAENGFTELESGKGYLYANSQTVTLGLKGTLEAGNATVNVPLSYTATAGNLKGFNLVGNPFAHNVTTFAGTNVAEEVYQLNDLRDEVVVGMISADHPLKPGEGFFVKATATDASITFNNSRATNAERSLSLSKGRITLDLSENGKLIDRFILKKDGHPLEKLTLNEHGTRLYATQDGQDYAVAVIGGRDGVHTVSTEMPVNFKAAKNGTYTLAVNVENMEFDYLHLIDNLTGADVDLLAANGGRDAKHCVSTYTFAAKTTDYVSRFRLVFSSSEMDGPSTGSGAFAFISNGNIVITADAHGASLQIVDVMGRVIRDCTDVARNVSTQGMTAGVYVLRLIDGEKVRTQKIVVE